MREELDPRAFPVEWAELPSGVRLAYIRVGAGGQPLLLIHGYPETKRIWWRNIGPLAELGFEVIAPDLRGYGDSGFAPDDYYDLAAFSRDLHILLREVLGHERCSTVAGDLGAMVAIDLALRFPGFVERQVIFGTALPELGDLYRKAGIPPDPALRSRLGSDYFLCQGLKADSLIAALDSREARLAYICSFYRERMWAPFGGFTRAQAFFMAEPFADRDRLRTSWAPYEAALGARPISASPLWSEPCPIPTLALYGAEDRAILPSFTPKARVAFPDCKGPFTVRGCGHFMQWERARMLNQTISRFANESPRRLTARTGRS